jgi:hypothetical protein
LDGQHVIPELIHRGQTAALRMFLQSRGWSQARIEALIHGSALRVLSAVLGQHPTYFDFLAFFSGLASDLVSVLVSVLVSALLVAFALSVALLVSVLAVSEPVSLSLSFSLSGFVAALVELPLDLLSLI